MSEKNNHMKDDELEKVSGGSMSMEDEEWVRNIIIEALDNGDLLIINARKDTEIGGGYGHYLNIRGYGNSKNEVLVYDQYGDTDYGHSGSWNTDYVLSQLNDAWVVTRKQ